MDFAACPRSDTCMTFTTLTGFAWFIQVIKIKVTGMHCSSCSTAVQKALSVATGVEKASVSLTLEQAEVVYDPGVVKEVNMSP